MAIRSFPYVSVDGDRKITATNEAERIDQIVDSGIIFDDPTSFECEIEMGTMNIKIAPGSAIIKGHGVISNATERVTIPDSESAYSRIDLIVLESNTNTEYRKAYIKVIKGTGAATPIEPQLSAEPGISQIKLAKVLVPSSVLYLDTATITDLRVGSFGKHNHTKKQIADIADCMVDNIYKNGFINGDFQVWQMGTSIVPLYANKYYTADMWKGVRDGAISGSTFSQVSYNSVVAKYATRAQRNVGDTSLASLKFGYCFTTAESKKYIGKKVTVSFSARIGANAAGSYTATILCGTGVDEDGVAGAFTGQSVLQTITFTPTVSDQIFSLTTNAVVASTVTELAFRIRYTPSTATAGGNDYFEITNCNWSATDFYVPFSPKSFVQTLFDCNGGEPVGTINMFSGNTAPLGWLLCQGQAVSRVTYASLFNIIGGTYGAGDGSTTFNVPNLKGRIPVGVDSSQTEFDTLGEIGGEKKHANSADENGPHTHLLNIGGTNINKATPYMTGGSGTFWNMAVGYEGINSFGINSSGNGTPHNNLQPYISLNYIIKY